MRVERGKPIMNEKKNGPVGILVSWIKNALISIHLQRKPENRTLPIEQT